MKKYKEYRRCPVCTTLMEEGIRWSKTRKRIKSYFYCPSCGRIFYKSDFRKH